MDTVILIQDTAQRLAQRLPVMYPTAQTVMTATLMLIPDQQKYVMR